MLRAMRSRLGFSILIAATGACNKSTPPEPRAPAPVAPAPAPAAGPAAGVIDQGVLHISARGKPAGEERFTLTGNDERRELVSKTTLRRGSTVAVEVEGTLVTDGRWRPEGGSFKHIASEGDKQKVSVHTLARQTTDAGPGGTLTLTVDQNPPIVEATPESPSDLYVNNLAVSHLGALCALARDDEREVKLFPGITLRLSGKRELEFATKAGAKKLNLVVFQAVGAEPVDVLCDGTRLVMVRQPSAQVVTTREGFEEIAEIIAEAEDRKPKIPAGLVELERSVTAPDGAPLACSFLAPADKRSPLPAVVLLGPAGGQDRDGDTTGTAASRARCSVTWPSRWRSRGWRACAATIAASATRPAARTRWCSRCWRATPRRCWWRCAPSRASTASAPASSATMRARRWRSSSPRATPR
jgi:hypothetical protein